MDDVRAQVLGRLEVREPPPGLPRQVVLGVFDANAECRRLRPGVGHGCGPVEIEIVGALDHGPGLGLGIEAEVAV